MRTLPAGLAAHLVGVTSTDRVVREDLITLTLRDSSVFRWTTCDRDVTTGGNTFRTAGVNGPMIERSKIRQSAGLNLDTVDLTLTGGTFLVGGKSLQLLAVQGWFDGARLKIDHLIGRDLPTALSFGPIASWWEGRVGPAEPQGATVKLRCKSELVMLNQPLPRFKVQPMCGHAVYDKNCDPPQTMKAAFTLAGTISAVTNSRVFATATAGIAAKATDYYNLGVLIFTSGALAGQKQAVEKWDTATDTFTMKLPFSAAPLVGDAFTVYPGCDRSRAQCSATKFNNLNNWRGFPLAPAAETVNF